MAIFFGFAGEKFQFDGKPNKVFNLLSDQSIHVNARFNTCNHVDLLGMQIGESSRINYIEWTANNNKIKINNNILQSKTYFPLGENDYFGTAEIKITTNEDLLSSLTVDIGKYNLLITRHKNTKLNPTHFFNIKINILNNNVRPHGIIGQTAFNKSTLLPKGQQGQGIIEGQPNDYEVNNIWSTNFKFNKFSKNEILPN